ncbi:MAG: 4Fe-4S ferredoxin [Anaerolineaceae bacterium 4572_32.1]|nr:MAG: 4Fe-4S ferredoxin [Anaerolineaceae bacterium 4572_32.1]
MSQPVWFVKLIQRLFPLRFLLARLTKIPLMDRIVERLFFKGDDIFYLPQDKVIQVNETISRPAEIVLPSQVVEYFIENATHHWIMNFCICRDSAHCEDYPIELGCIFLGEAAQGINPRLGRRVTKEEALEHARRCREAGLVHMIGRNKLDTMWLGVGPGEKLLTICNCCPCCCLWRVLPHIAPQIGAKIRRMPGVTVTVTERCVGCGTCTQGICFVDAIHLLSGQAVISDACRGCGRCVDVCPQKAIELVITDARFVEASINQLEPLVDLL